MHIPFLDRLLGRPRIALEPPQFRPMSIAEPSERIGWLDALADGATCGEPHPRTLTLAEERAADERQRQIVKDLRNARCAR